MKRKKLRPNPLDVPVNYLLNGEAEFDKEVLKKKEMGLSLVLLGLADVTSSRLQRLTSALQLAEEKIFSKDTIKSLSPLELIGLYKLALGSMDKGSDFITQVVKGIDWSELGVQLDISTAPPDNKSVSDLGEDTLKEGASTLLSIVSRLHGERESKKVSSDD